ncbi:uncharacterized protein [Cherax quadricarinatus]|uniref:uncharacterized protein isoform X2 n=1 Tax=Cherax quadricarinatus TaxID=27406 RepID=UPI00387EBFB6
MNKTLLFLNGQPVILTSAGTDSLIQTNAALTTSLEGSAGVASQDDEKGLFDPPGTKHAQLSSPKLEESENLQESLKPNFVQVRVNGREVPGFMLSQEKAGGVPKIISQPVNQKVEYGLLSPGKTANGDGSEKGNAVESGGFLQFHSAPVQRGIAKDSNFADVSEESCGSDVFALATNNELLRTQVEGSSQEIGSVESLQNLVRLPIVPNHIQVDAQNLNISVDHGQIMHVGVGTNDSHIHSRNMSTIVAIIQGEDGSTQTIELSPEEACKLNLPQLLDNNVATEQHSVTSPAEKVEELSAGHPHLPTDQTSQLKEVERSPEGSDGSCTSIFTGEDGTDGIGGNDACDVSAGDADVSLGPFLLIPEYNADGTISMLQIRGSEPEVKSEVSAAEPLSTNSVSLSDSQLHHARESNGKSLLSFPHTGQNVQKISLPVNSTHPSKAHNKAKHTDWKTASSKSAPKVPGSIYLRDIAKRTKFRNLTSFLDTKPVHEDCEVLQESPDIEIVESSSTFNTSIAGLSGTATASPQPLVLASSSEFTLGSGNHLLTRSPFMTGKKVSSQLNIKDIPFHMSHLPSSASLLHRDATAKLHQVSTSCGDRPLTIKVSTGPICATTSKLQTAVPSTTPVPSIKCAGDETPFTVHLPGGDNTKPLGSSENPIQLVQQGNTFQALQPVQERQLEQITTLLQQRRITAPPTTHHDHHEIYDPKTNMKIVYKVVFPEDIMEVDDDDEDDEESKDGNLTWEGRLGLLNDKKKGRKSKEWKKVKLNEEEEEVDIEMLDETEERNKQINRTRSGRISRPPRHMMKDFKHLHPINFKNDNKDKDSPGVGYSDYDDHHHIDPDDKLPEPVELPRRKKRSVPPTTRLRYTCLTCGKLYMGRIEAHYKKFPDHRQELQSDLKQSYSAIKTLSDSFKTITDDGGEVNKSVLSPTPGTQASETSGEPSLPMETLTTQPTPTETASYTPPLTNTQTPQFDVPHELTPVKPGRGRSRRGRRGSRSKGRGSRGGPARSAAAATNQPPPPAASPVNMLEKILSGYSSEEIQKAVGKRLVENLTPWQVLCFQAQGSNASSSQWSWQDKFCILQSLLKEFKEDFEKQMEPFQDILYNDGQEFGHKHNVPILNKDSECSDNVESSKLDSDNVVKQMAVVKNEKSLARNGEESVSNQVMSEDPASVSTVKVCDYLARVLGIASGVYKEQEQSHSPTILCSTDASSALMKNSLTAPVNTDVIKQELEMDDKLDETASKRIRKEREMCEKGLDQKSTVVLNGDQSLHCNIVGIDIATYQRKVEEYNSVGCVNKALEDATHSLDLSSFSLSAQISSEPNLGPGHLQTSISTTSSSPSSSSSSSTMPEGTTGLPVSAQHFSMPINNDHVSVSSTSLTMSQAASCVPHTSAVTSVTSSLPLQVPNFTSHNTNSVSAISSCLPLSNIDSSLMSTSTIPQVNTMQQMPLGDLDITAEDLPRLLSEGTGLVVSGNGDGCDAPKLLDTSGDTTDLSEMLFKLQEATASISQSQDPNLGPPVYQQHIMTSSQVTTNGNPLILPQSHSVHSEVNLPSRSYDTVGQPLNSHNAPNLNLKLDTTHSSSEPSMPRLTFAGALETNSDFHSPSPINQAVSGSENGAKAQVLLDQANDHQRTVTIDQTEASLVSSSNRLSIGFNVSESEFEDLLKR